MEPLTTAIVPAMLATAVSLIARVSSMATGHEIGHRSCEQWMIFRIGFQGLAVALLLLALYLR